jgi:hypothetical protein
MAAFSRARRCAMRTPRRRLHAQTQALLEFVRANPGLTAYQLSARLGRDVRCRLETLERAGLASVEEVAGKRLWHAGESGADQVGASPAQAGEVAAPRRVDVCRPWPQPYLSDAHIRPDGLDHKRWPSRYGDTRVHEYLGERPGHPIKGL